MTAFGDSYQVGNSQISNAEVDRWRKLAAIPDDGEKAMVGGRAKALYEKQAKERQKRKPESVPVNCPEQKSKGDARDKAGEAVGVSGKQIDRLWSKLRCNGL